MRSPVPLLSVLALVAAGCSTSKPTVPQRAIPAAIESEREEPESADVAEGEAAHLYMGMDPEQETPPEPEPEPEPAAGPTPASPTKLDPGSVPIARIGETEISLAELLATWVQTDSQGVRDMLERMASSRMVALEAGRQEITVDPERVRERYAATLREMERDLQLQQPGMSLDRWIEEGLGLEPLEYRASIEEEVKRRLYAERVVRAYVYSQEWADVRIIVVETQEQAQAAATRIRDGEPFGRLAAEVSIDPGGKLGGRLPPVLRTDSALARLAFDTPVGELGGPILEGRRWMLIQTDGIHAPLLGDWGEIAPKIETSLEERPIEDPEYWMWKVEMQDRHPVDFGPFFDLIGGSMQGGPAGG